MRITCSADGRASRVDDSQQVVFPFPSDHDVSPPFAIGEPVRVIDPSGEIAPGAQGRVVGYYRSDPPRTLVAFDGVSYAVPDSRLERGSLS
jgi:hypothetical protein